MIRFELANEAFIHSVERSREMVRLFDALCLMRSDPKNDDALRASYFQAVSSFDYYIHEIVLAETRYRIQIGYDIKKIQIPISIIHIEDISEKIESTINYVKEQNSFRAFVDPDKLSEILKCYCDNPWILISKNFQNSGPNIATPDLLKQQLRSIWKRRNKIAHEADINPILSGVSLWPIDKNDAEITIDFLAALAPAVMKAIVTPFP